MRDQPCSRPQSGQEKETIFPHSIEVLLQNISAAKTYLEERPDLLEKLRVTSPAHDRHPMRSAVSKFAGMSTNRVKDGWVIVHKGTPEITAIAPSISHAGDVFIVYSSIDERHCPNA